MISPYVRRLRLGSELKALRLAAGLTHEKLAAKVTPSRQQISRLENGQIPPDQDDILQLLDALGVDGDRWNELMTIAREAAERGWWEGSSKAIGERQARFADLEAGAATIREYAQTIIPGLLQTAEFTRTRIGRNTGWPLPQGITIEGILRGRATRQRMLHRPGGGPEYEVILDEFAIRRQCVPARVLRDQLVHVAELAADDNRVSVRVLPVDVQIEGYEIPMSSFSIHTYPDPGDPVVVAIEAVTTDVLLTEHEQAAAYMSIFDGLRATALSTEDSHEYLIKAAESLPSQ